MVRDVTVDDLNAYGGSFKTATAVEIVVMARPMQEVKVYGVRTTDLQRRQRCRGGGLHHSGASVSAAFLTSIVYADDILSTGAYGAGTAAANSRIRSPS